MNEAARSLSDSIRSLESLQHNLDALRFKSSLNVVWVNVAMPTRVSEPRKYYAFAPRPSFSGDRNLYPFEETE